MPQVPQKIESKARFQQLAERNGCGLVTTFEEAARADSHLRALGVGFAPFALRQYWFERAQ